jgi:tetratricopeptide (TPR) repeat protein
LAAALGLEIDAQEWKRACDEAHLPASSDMVDELLEQRLAVCRSGNPDEGWSLVHTMLRECLIRRATESGRWAQHNLACAQMLATRKSAEALERRGLHLLQGNQPQEAVTPLLESLWERIDAQELSRVRQMLDQWQTLLAELSWPQHHHYWGEAWLLEARYARGTGFYEVAMQWAERAVEDARQYNWEHVFPRALLWFSYYSWLSGGDPDTSWQYMQEAEQVAKRLLDRETLLQCYRQIGDFLTSRGMLERAMPYFQHALQESTDQRDTKGIGRAYHGMAIVERQAGNHEQAWHWAEHAKKYFEEGGHRRGAADCLTVFGDLARMQGKLEEAESYYREGMELSYRLGTGNEALFELNLGLVLNEKGKFTQARSVLQNAQRGMAWRKRALLEGAAHMCILPSLAHQRDWEAWQNHVEQVRSRLDGSGFYDVDLAKSATMAGDIAMQKGAPGRAKEAYELALEQWKHLERTEETESVQRKILHLPGHLQTTS